MSESTRKSPLAALRARLRGISDGVGATHEQTTAARRDLAEHARQVSARLDAIEAGQHRERLHELPRRADYEQAFTSDRPLVSIVIPTYDNYESLGERALPSALGQTYDRIEVIVVGDQAPPQTAEVVESVGDERVRYVNRPVRGPYPDDPTKRWYVAGVPPYNDGVEPARGEWIAPLDDDDEFTLDHVERLLDFARSERAELAYGLIREHRPGGIVNRLGAFPPAFGEFGLQACIYHAGLAEIFQLALSDWIFEEPYDLALARRMLRAGVRAAMLDEEVVEYWPSRYWNAGEPVTSTGEPRQQGSPVPEWAAGAGWPAAANDPGGGWRVEAVAEAYRQKWPQFLRAIDGPGPLGVSHETPVGVPFGREDPIAHNVVYSFAHALNTAGRGRDRISVLDWGGATGHYFELARRLTDVGLDWHCRELPAVCAVGRELAPEVTFQESDECLDGEYDLVLVSGALQYVEDWQPLLERLVRAASPYLFLTKVPVVESHPSYVAIQRAYAYGYETEYPGWILHRGELIQATLGHGLEVVREYALIAAIDVAGAPENPKHIGLLFRAAG